MGRSWRYCLLMASTAISQVPDKIKTGLTFDVACVRIPHDCRGLYDDLKGT